LRGKRVRRLGFPVASVNREAPEVESALRAVLASTPVACMLFARHLPARDSDASPHAPILAGRPGFLVPGPSGSPATRSLLSEPPRLFHHAGPVFPACALVAARPFPDPSAPHWAPLISFGRAPRPSASEAGFRSAPGATKALAPLVARPAVYPTGPAARGYDAGDDMTTSRPLGCTHPWSSSVGREDRG